MKIRTGAKRFIEPPFSDSGPNHSSGPDQDPNLKVAPLLCNITRKDDQGSLVLRCCVKGVTARTTGKRASRRISLEVGHTVGDGHGHLSAVRNTLGRSPIAGSSCRPGIVAVA